MNASPLGIDRDAVLAGINDPEVKAIARQHGEAAVARGVLGSPWIFVDGEPFWGSDRFGRRHVALRFAAGSMRRSSVRLSRLAPISHFLPGCCARAASGHATAAPATIVMNSRRLVCRPRGGAADRGCHYDPRRCKHAKKGKADVP